MAARPTTPSSARRLRPTAQRRALTEAAWQYAAEIGSQVRSIRWRAPGGARRRADLAYYFAESGCIELSAAITTCADRAETKDVIFAAKVLCHEIWHGVSPCAGLGRVEEACVETLAWYRTGRLIELSQLQLPGLRSDRPGLGVLRVGDGDRSYEHEFQWLRQLARIGGLPADELAERILRAECPQYVIAACVAFPTYGPRVRGRMLACADSEPRRGSPDEQRMALTFLMSRQLRDDGWRPDFDRIVFEQPCHLSRRLARTVTGQRALVARAA